MPDLVVGSADVAAAVVALTLAGRQADAQRLVDMIGAGVDVQDDPPADAQGVDGRPLGYAVQDARGVSLHYVVDAQGHEHKGKGPGGGQFTGKGGGGGTHSAADFPASVKGRVRLVDRATGESLMFGDAAEIRDTLAAARSEGDDVSGLDVVESSEGEQADIEAAAKAEQEERRRLHDEEVARRRAEESRDPNRPGGRNWVDPPPVLWHATFAGDAIRRDGFKTAEELGHDVLGGVSRNTVSFTTRENAEQYLKGLQVARDVAQGRLDVRDPGTAEYVGSLFGASPEGVAWVWKNTHLARGASGDSPPRWGFNFLQLLSMETHGRFPLFMGGDWSDAVKNAPPPSLVGVESASGRDMSYNPSETEWRVGDPRGLRVVA